MLEGAVPLMMGDGMTELHQDHDQREIVDVHVLEQLELDNDHDRGMVVMLVEDVVVNDLLPHPLEVDHDHGMVEILVEDVVVDDLLPHPLEVDMTVTVAMEEQLQQDGDYDHGKVEMLVEDAVVDDVLLPHPHSILRMMYGMCMEWKLLMMLMEWMWRK